MVDMKYHSVVFVYMSDSNVFSYQVYNKMRGCTSLMCASFGVRVYKSDVS